jgi:hypothetical protein
MQPEMIIGIIGLLFGIAPQVAAIVGPPSWIQRARIAKKGFDMLAGNYGRAKNRD